MGRSERHDDCPAAGLQLESEYPSAEQTLGRGLRRMTPPAAETTVNEVVTVVEHPAFHESFEEQLFRKVWRLLNGCG